MPKSPPKITGRNSPAKRCGRCLKLGNKPVRRQPRQFLYRRRPGRAEDHQMGNGPGDPGPPLFRCEIQAPGGNHHSPAPPPRRQAQLTAAHHLERAPEAPPSDGMTSLPVDQVLTERGEQVSEPAEQVPEQVKEIHMVEYWPPSGASPRATECPG
jgi:hypothetical protein